MSEAHDSESKEAQRIFDLCVLKTACDNLLETVLLIEGGDERLSFGLAMPQVGKDYFYLRAELTSHGIPLASSRASTVFMEWIRPVLYTDPLLFHLSKMPPNTETTCYLASGCPDGSHLSEKIKEIYKQHDTYVKMSFAQNKVDGGLEGEGVGRLMGLLPAHSGGFRNLLRIYVGNKETIKDCISALRAARELVETRVSRVPLKDQKLLLEIICAKTGVTLKPFVSGLLAQPTRPDGPKKGADENPMEPC